MKYLVDVNLPYKFAFFNNSNFIHQRELNSCSKDSEIWDFCKEKILTILTKDADFVERIIVSEPPPKVIHFKLGNCSIKTLYDFFEQKWNTIEEFSQSYKLVNVYWDRIEGIE